MDVDDYLSQYERINLQQHFGKVDVPEKLYIEYIHNFVIQAANNIPHELSLLVKKNQTLPYLVKSSIFDWCAQVNAKNLKIENNL